uniref:ribosomal protein L29 n=1 Tax=Meringosphaera mediterranea TaxID=2837474 RepID=UPI00286BA4F8|nr:ribosomal protein L29 [Meringosphaera mediterranea]WLD05725.1 ribosomal protein L29 [Meringosphaera mediterranea]WLD05865.1 ribosomal protein L29 [Meringosphaera mediterranea]WLD06085.1 ribosomal protein L29 [Meringosphaera mediterranea]
MAFKKIADIKNLDQQANELETLKLSKELVELKLKRATRQTFKAHEFKHKRRQIAQLLTISNQ